MMKTTNKLMLSALVLGGTMGASAFAQSTMPATPVTQTSTTQPSSSQANGMAVDDMSSYATGKPLSGQSKEGFWGHMNPLARKKWVNRQVTPIKERANELDQLQAKNANDIKDVDSRSQAGINKALMAANTADSNAMDAGNRANAANTLAGTASTKTDALHTTVGNLDQYSEVTSTAVPFAAGHTTLGKTAKANLDDVAEKLANEKGYILEVQGYSRGGVQASQAMADSVVRYLVTEHQVPIYRIYRSGLGKNTNKPADGEKLMVNGVRVTLLHNSLATMDSAPTTGSTGSTTAEPSSTTSQSTGVSAPPAN